MRYFSYIEYEKDSLGEIVTVSEDHIRQNYYPYWRKTMVRLLSEDRVRESYSFEDCLGDWIALNWAWEVEAPT